MFTKKNTATFMNNQTFCICVKITLSKLDDTRKACRVTWSDQRDGRWTLHTVTCTPYRQTGPA